MDKNQKDITTEVTVSIQAKKFKFSFGWKQSWSIALILAIVRGIIWILEH